MFLFLIDVSLSLSPFLSLSKINKKHIRHEDIFFNFQKNTKLAKVKPLLSKNIVGMVDKQIKTGYSDKRGYKYFREVSWNWSDWGWL